MILACAITAILAALAAVWLTRNRGLRGGQPAVPPQVTGTADRTAQRPKARPWHDPISRRYA
jgi:hypothetical protein